MSCWRVLELAEQPDSEQIPQLLVKPVFGEDSYTVHLTDLCYIWSEELDLEGIVGRASHEQSPIDVSKEDTTQLAILLDNVKKPLDSSDDATCRITRNSEEGIVLHTSISLPAPLESLTWKFYLEKRTSITLKNELILPLLVSSHIQHRRITGLISTIADKDKAITRLVDQYESSNLDLAAAFPSVGSLKAGRRGIKREQAAKHVPALQPFRETVWRRETGQLEESDVTTLGLFQEALAQSTPKVPPQLKSEEHETSWWTAVPYKISLPAPASNRKAKRLAPNAELKQITAEASEDETEDEFETHENFKTRNLPRKTTPAPDPVSAPPRKEQARDDSESTEDDEDLDAPPKDQSQTRTLGKPRPRTKSTTPEVSPPARVSTPPATKSKGKGFRIGGKARKVSADSQPLSQGNQDTPPDTEDQVKEPSSPQADSQMNWTPKKARRPFKIGGKAKDDSSPTVSASPKTTGIGTTRSPTAEPPSSPPPNIALKEETPEAVHEETPEEKAERRRAELKRKNEEAAKKQSLQKKKRRF
ncbi:Nn.00g011540.m01.CDS01 [Neocucurbitaria sp. VM-36]